MDNHTLAHDPMVFPSSIIPQCLFSAQQNLFNPVVSPLCFSLLLVSSVNWKADRILSPSCAWMVGAGKHGLLPTYEPNPPTAHSAHLKTPKHPPKTIICWYKEAWIQSQHTEEETRSVCCLMKCDWMCVWSYHTISPIRMSHKELLWSSAQWQSREFHTDIDLTVTLKLSFPMSGAFVHLSGWYGSFFFCKGETVFIKKLFDQTSTRTCVSICLSSGHVTTDCCSSG